MNSPYSASVRQPSCERAPPPTSRVRSVFLAACQKIASAPPPHRTAAAFRHHGSFFGFHAADSSAAGGSGWYAVSGSGWGGTVPPITVITSSGVTACGHSVRAMRLAEVV